MPRSGQSRYADIPHKQFKSWALHPSHTFFVCTFQDHFFGLIFNLRLKPKAFERLIRLEIREKDLKEEDFATYDEIGSCYTLFFFAMNDKAAAALFIRHYAHLIAHQEHIDRVGFAYIMEDAARLVKNMNFRYETETTLKEGLVLQTFSQTLPELLASENTMKRLFGKQECPEE